MGNFPTKTKEEYEAAAMLLWLNYDDTVNTMYRLPNAGDTTLVEFDADTLKPLSTDEVIKRVRERINKGVRSI